MRRRMEVTELRNSLSSSTLAATAFASSARRNQATSLKSVSHSMEVIMDVNPDKLNAFMGKMVSDVGSAMNASLILVGEKLGLYKALAAKGPMDSTELAKATGTSERYVREWLSAQAASGYIEYDAASAKFVMPPEQALALADEDSPVFLGAVGNMVAAGVLEQPALSDGFKFGQGAGD